jgi:hypothetical protein
MIDWAEKRPGAHVHTRVMHPAGKRRERRLKRAKGRRADFGSCRHEKVAGTIISKPSMPLSLNSHICCHRLTFPIIVAPPALFVHNAKYFCVKKVANLQNVHVARSLPGSKYRRTRTDTRLTTPTHSTTPHTHDCTRTPHTNTLNTHIFPLHTPRYARQTTQHEDDTRNSFPAPTHQHFQLNTASELNTILLVHSDNAT